MAALDTNLWPLLMGVLFLTIAGICQWRIQRVPNVICAAWLLGALGAGFAIEMNWVTSYGGLAACLMGIVLGFAMLMPFYAKLQLGAGCVKAQAVFGGWVGCAFSATNCFKFVLVATVVACIFTASTVVIAWMDARDGESNRSPMFPAQITLSVGSIFAAWIVAMGV